MQSTVIVAFAILACVYAQVLQPLQYEEENPDRYQFIKHSRQRRGFSWDGPFGGGTVFGKLGSLDNGSPFGRAGYTHDIFDDSRGRLTGTAFGSRVLGPSGGESYMGGKLNWNNPADDIRAGLEVSKQIGGRTSAQADLSRVWRADKDTRFILGGTVSQADVNHGTPEIGIAGKLEHTFGN